MTPSTILVPDLDSEQTYDILDLFNRYLKDGVRKIVVQNANLTTSASAPKPSARLLSFDPHFTIRCSVSRPGTLVTSA